MTIPGHATTLGAVVARNARLHADKPAIVFEGRTLTFAGLFEVACRLANALLTRGMRRGDRIAVLSQNCLEYMEVFAAAEIAGLTVVNLNWRLTVQELRPILEDCRPEFLFAEQQYASRADELATLLPGQERLLVWGVGGEATSGYEAFRNSGSPNPPAVQAQSEDTAYIIYTSGTTGKPKGVMLGQHGLLGSAYSIALDSGARPTDRMLIVMPLFHIGARIEYLSFAVMGATVFLYRQFDVNEVLGELEKREITVAHLAPAMVQMIMDAPSLPGRNFASLRLVHYASAPMNSSLLRRAIRRFGNIFLQLYGMTESVSGTILHPHQHVLDGTPEQVARLMSAGQPISTTSLRVVRPDGTHCEDGETGEVLLKCPANMQGYWNNTILQKEVLRDGWMHTGDMGYLDREGFLFIVDRKKDMIVSGGENIYSREVEEALLTHPAVADASVIGVPDEKWGEAVKACVVLRIGQSVGEAELVSHVRDRIASYKKPKSIDFVASLPRLFNGKIDKKALREPYWMGRERRI
jgi:acyl-CoA synthetase (AMP-forming)/AMP-acid ligase II